MKGFLCLVLSALFFSNRLDAQVILMTKTGKQEQGLHLLSLKVKVIAMVENEDNLFLVEALESYKDEINQGDTISVATDSTEVSDILETYQEHNNFRIYFPKTTTILRMVISVTCLVCCFTYDSSGRDHPTGRAAMI